MDLNAPVLLDFLDHLEANRANRASSRNARLCAIKSFFHIVGVRDPANMALVSRGDRRNPTYRDVPGGRHLDERRAWPPGDSSFPTPTTSLHFSNQTRNDRLSGESKTGGSTITREQAR
jgi:hypothetical protein